MTLKATLDAVLQQATDNGDVPGVVAMVTNREHSIYEGAFGLRSLGHAEAMTAETVGLIASMTKALTATAAMQLVEQGRLDLDSPASTWLPSLGTAQVLEGFDAAGHPRLRAPKTPITLRNLLTHTSGFGYEFLSEDIQRYKTGKSLPGFIACAKDSLDSPLLFDPGERWFYGIGIDQVGLLVEAVTGQRLGEYLAANVLGPLGMGSTGFFITPAMRSRLAKIHARLEGGQLVPIDLEVPQAPEVEMGGGGLYGTVGDYLKFARMLLNRGRADDGTVLLKPETVDLMFQDHIAPLTVPSLPSADRTLTNDLVMSPDFPHGWGLSFALNTVPLPTGRSAGSAMWAGLANSYYWIDPVKGIAGVYLTQILPFADVKSMPLFLGFEYSVYQNL